MPNDPMEAGRHAAPARARARDVERHLGARIRERRLALGLSQRELAGPVGVTRTQVGRYEAGATPIAPGRLQALARALDVGVDHLFEGLGDGRAPRAPEPTSPRQRRARDLARAFVDMPDRRQQEALCRLAHVLADWDRLSGPETGAAA